MPLSVRSLPRWRMEDRLQFGKPPLGYVLAPKSGITFESRDQRVKRAILMVRRAEPAELCARRIDEPLLEGFDQARLANARLTRQQHDLAVPALARVQRRSRISISSSRPTS